MASETTSTKLCLRALVFYIWVSILTQTHSLQSSQSFQSCEMNSLDALGYRCNGPGWQDRCATFVAFRANSYYSSLSNLSLYLGLDHKAIAEANGFSTTTEFLLKDQLLLIPVDCRCNGGYFEAMVTKTTIKDESFNGIAESLEGLTTCKAIKNKNPGLAQVGLKDKVRLLVPLRCVCPSPFELKQGKKLMLTYPITFGDTLPSLAFRFNVTKEAIISSNNRLGGPFKPASLVPFSTLLVPLDKKPILGLVSNPLRPNSTLPSSGIPILKPPNKHHKKKQKIGVYVALGGIAVGAIAAVVAAVMVVQRRKKKPEFCKTGEVELKQLRIRSEVKAISESSQDPFDTQTIGTTPHKTVEIYSLEELTKATEAFNSSNIIQGSVFHGRLNGKSLAIKRARTEAISKIDFGLFEDTHHHHHRSNFIQLLGTCIIDGPDSFLVFEYAKNGSLKDWLHGGLAMKSQFIASCYCFLKWNQRLRICLDVAIGLQYMHQVMNPSYVHRNIKSKNILLDEQFNAKIRNFGMERCGASDSEDSCSRGYLAPEFLHRGIISPSMDIFAYGVVLLEVLSGQTPISTRTSKKGEGNVLLSDKIKSIILLLLRSDDAEELRKFMDPVMGDSYSFENAVTMANLARACVEEDPLLRPKAGEIVDKLSRLVEELPEGEQTLEGSAKP